MLLHSIPPTKNQYQKDIKKKFFKAASSSFHAMNTS